MCVCSVNQGSIIYIDFWKNENETQFRQSRNEVGIRFNIFVYVSVTFRVLERGFCTRLRHMFEDYIYYRYVIIQVFGTKTTSMYLYVYFKERLCTSFVTPAVAVVHTCAIPILTVKTCSCIITII